MSRYALVRDGLGAGSDAVRDNFRDRYKANDPKGFGGDPKRGAALGRPDRIGDPAYAGVLTLRRVRIDRDGYDGLGTYWGLSPTPLYWFASPSHHIDRTVRAADREAAREYVLREYPNATVKR